MTLNEFINKLNELPEEYKNKNVYVSDKNGNKSEPTIAHIEGNILKPEYIHIRANNVLYI